MKYPQFEELDLLLEKKLITARNHPYLPLKIYNYSPSVMGLAISEWSEALKDCRGLILDHSGEIVGRPFKKFWNLEQSVNFLTQLNEPARVHEKMDGSLGIVAYYFGERVVSSRGSFESEQSVWLKNYMDKNYPDFYPSGETYLFEIIYPTNRIVVDYGKREEAVLLGIMSPDGVDLWDLYDSCTRFKKAKDYGGLDLNSINENPNLVGQEGFVVCWPFGQRVKVKLDEYKHLHRLVTQTTTRSIWELLKSGKPMNEVIEHVPEDFKQWVIGKINQYNKDFYDLYWGQYDLYNKRPNSIIGSRKEFAEWATQQKHPGIQFMILDDHDITQYCWKLVEPRYEKPFKSEQDYL